MAGAAVTVSTAQVERMSARLAQFQGKLRNPKGVARGIGQLLEAQTKRRIQDEKTAPDGTAWARWSDETASQRKGHHSLLLFEGRLRDSVVGQALNGTTVVVGASMIYAAVHQYGHTFANGRKVPARPFLGMSDDNADEVVDLILDWAGGALGAA